MITFKDHEDKAKVKVYLENLWIMDIENSELNK